MQAENSVDSHVAMVLSVCLQAASMQALRRQGGSLGPATAPERHSESCETSDQPFVQGADLVTGSGWQAAASSNVVSSASLAIGLSSSSSRPPHQGDGPRDSTNPAEPAQSSRSSTAGPRPSQQRRLDATGDCAESRLHCPVEGCPASDVGRSTGWTCTQSLRDHLVEHISGRLQGDIPQEFLSEHRLTVCTVCNRLLSTRFGTVCPRCRPDILRAQPPATTGRPIPDDYPSLEEVFRTSIRCKSYIPKAAKRLRAQCLLAAMAAVLRHNDELAWLDLLTLPEAVLRASARGGRQHRFRIDAKAKRLCKDWLDGHRAQLWRQSKSLAAHRRGARRNSPEEALTQREERAIRLIKEELLSKACGALADGKVAQVTPAIRREMNEKHPNARDDDVQRMGNLRQVHAAAGQTVDAETVWKAARSFAKGSAAGPTGLRPQHLKDAMVAGLEDEVARHFVQIATLLSFDL